VRPLVKVGCSGWQYKHWRGVFYPAELPIAQWFRFYAGQFDTVEINNTFYRLPEPSVFARWRRQAPAGFVYSVKASRFITHMKKLKDPEEPLDHLCTRAALLGRAFGPLLFQLPPHWPVNHERLATFLQALPRDRRCAIEFRDPSWYGDSTLAALEAHGVALCLHDMAGSASGKERVGPFVYARFHGVTKYAGSYSDPALEGWAEWLALQIQSGAAVFAYFNNDADGQAPRDAARLSTKLAQLSA
jgi:uncharacterized protein YecE (DUF72 family)